MPPVANAPVLQWVSTFAPSGRIVRPCSPILRHIARSSSQIVVASTRSRSHRSLPSPDVASATRHMRSSAQRRFTAVGRVVTSMPANSFSRVRNSPREATRCSRRPVTTPIAAAMPISGAPRTCSCRIASATDAAERIATEAEIKGAILTGAGPKSFVAGADISDLSRQGPFDGKARAQRGQGVLRRLETCGKPVIAAINGFALGGGCELAMACHMRIASENAKFGQPEVKLGIAPGYGGTQRLPRLVGKGVALQLILTGEMIDAQEAYRIGLVNKVVPAADVLVESEKMMRGILAMGPLAVRLAMEAVDQGL